MNVIDPNDHYSLPSGYRFSRSDAESFLQERRFVNQPYDPFTNLPFPRADVDGILQGMVQFLANPPPNPATRRQRPGIQLHPGNIVAPGAQRVRPVCPWGGLQVHRRDGKGGWGDTKGRPALEEGPVGPSGRVKGEWLTCQKSKTASQHVGPYSQEPPNTADAERAAEAEGQVAVVCRATAGRAALD